MVSRIAARIAGFGAFGGATLLFGVYGVWMIDHAPSNPEDAALMQMFGIAAVIAAFIAASATSPFIGRASSVRVLLISAPFAAVTALVLIWLAWALLAAGVAAGVLAGIAAIAGLASYGALLADASARRHAGA